MAAIFAVLVGAEIAGVIGVYLSVPIMASVRILWRRWQRYSQMQANARPQSSKSAKLDELLAPQMLLPDAAEQLY